MTLIELLVTVLVIGAIVTVLSSALVVTLRQQGDTAARTDVARWEQSLALWLPSDLASAATVSNVPSEAPCTSATCTYGSNALMLTWDDGSGTTTVSYRYGPAEDGLSFVLTRVHCHGGTCQSQVVLRDLAKPPSPWSAGSPVPESIIDVTIPLDVQATNEDGLGDSSTRAQRVIVNVNGAPGPDGVSRSSTISFTAGGATRTELPPAQFDGPTFLQASTGCGGPVTLIIDESDSIGSDDAKVRTGVTNFIDTFAGTPTRLQMITFSDRSATLGTTGWNKFYDLSEPTDVTAAKAQVSSISHGGGTNWEDALRRAFYAENGQTYAQLGNPAAPVPELVVFFTDGEPTFWRDSSSRRTPSTSTTPAPPSIPAKYDWDTAGNSGYGSDFSPKGWYRADYIVDQFRDIRMIGVGVGNAFDDSTAVRRTGWPSHVSGPWWNQTTTYDPIPNEVFLGDLVAGNDPSTYGSGSSGDYVKRVYSSTSGWGDVSAVDVLFTNNFNQFGSALTSIALAECGGTLTVQTRDAAGAPADASVTYQVGDEIVTTTRIQKSGTFEVTLDGVVYKDVELLPQSSFDGTGYTPQSWSCRAGGHDLVQGTDFWSLGSAGAGIRVRVRADSAIACTLRVA